MLNLVGKQQIIVVHKKNVRKGESEQQKQSRLKRERFHAEEKRGNETEEEREKKNEIPFNL